MYVVSSGALKVEIDTLPETNSKFTPENIWLEDKILVLLVIRPIFQWLIPLFVSLGVFGRQNSRMPGAAEFCEPKNL